MKGSYLENIYFKKQDDHPLGTYRKHKNFCSRSYKQERKKFFNNLISAFVSDNKLFCRRVKPLSYKKNRAIFIERIILKYQFQTSISIVNDKIRNTYTFRFQSKIKVLNLNKATT